jgi:N-acetylglucosaminyldiphosphoundecaprenol N-acetyl-beta-D-mannosaminyltransferase
VSLPKTLDWSIVEYFVEIMEKVDILGVGVHCTGKAGLIEQVYQWSLERQSRSVTYVNAHCLNTANDNPDYMGLLNNFDLIYADGISVVYAAYFLYRAQLEKMTGREWIYAFCKMAAERSLRVYIIAGRSVVAKQARDNLCHAFPGLQIVGAVDGFFIERTEMDILQEINDLRPDVVFVGMGTPIQEMWIAAHRSKIQAPVCWAVGALFDYVAGVEPPVPNWLNAVAMEWLWRLIVDPFGKWRRYLIGLPMFSLRILRQKLSQNTVSSRDIS